MGHHSKGHTKQVRTGVKEEETLKSLSLMSIQVVASGPGGMAQQLGTLLLAWRGGSAVRNTVALVEDLGLVPCTHMVAQPFVGFRRTSVLWQCTYMVIHTCR